MRFFRIKEKGSFGRPTPQVLVWAAVLILASWVFLRDHPFVAIFIATPGSYIVAVLFFSSPYRHSLAKRLHKTRFETITSLPWKRDQKWLDANNKTLKKTGITVFYGTDHMAVKKEDVKEKIKTAISDGDLFL